MATLAGLQTGITVGEMSLLKEGHMEGVTGKGHQGFGLK